MKLWNAKLCLSNFNLENLSVSFYRNQRQLKSYDRARLDPSEDQSLDASQISSSFKFATIDYYCDSRVPNFLLLQT